MEDPYAWLAEYKGKWVSVKPTLMEVLYDCADLGYQPGPALRIFECSSEGYKLIPHNKYATLEGSNTEEWALGTWTWLVK